MIPCPGVGILKMIPCLAGCPRTENIWAPLPPPGAEAERMWIQCSGWRDKSQQTSKIFCSATAVWFYIVRKGQKSLFQMVWNSRVPAKEPGWQWLFDWQHEKRSAARARSKIIVRRDIWASRWIHKFWWWDAARTRQSWISPTLLHFRVLLFPECVKNNVSSVKSALLIFFIYQLKENYNYYKNTITLTVTFMARKDTRSPGPHHECHLHFNYKLIQREQKLSRTKKRGGAAATFRH